MSKIIFIDDEKEVLAHYMNTFAKKKSSEHKLREMAADFFSNGYEYQEVDDFKNIETFSATQGLEAVEIVEREKKSGRPIEVAFIDMRMPPGIDGKETAKRIRAIDDRIEIVIVTAFSDTKLDQLVKEIDAKDKLLYLKKPFETTEIRQLITNLTTKYRGERVKEEFMSNVTHELKTPLASILGFTELMLSESDENQQTHEYLKIVQTNGELMRILINDLIDSTSFAFKGIQLHKEKTELSSLINEIIHSFRVINKNQNVSIESVNDYGPIYSQIDPSRFRQVLINIIGNSVKFTQKGCISAKIERAQGLIKLSIKDTGPGIPKEHLSSVFEKFHRVENEHHNIPGLGLGLYIVKSLLDAHNIKFSLQSSLREGTCFTLDLVEEPGTIN